jgi:hypothetical protein
VSTAPPWPVAYCRSMIPSEACFRSRQFSACLKSTWYAITSLLCKTKRHFPICVNKAERRITCPSYPRQHTRFLEMTENLSPLV